MKHIQISVAMFIWTNKEVFGGDKDHICLVYTKQNNISEGIFIERPIRAQYIQTNNPEKYTIHI